jgi:hypothetical protein
MQQLRRDAQHLGVTQFYKWRQITRCLSLSPSCTRLRALLSLVGWGAALSDGSVVWAIRIENCKFITSGGAALSDGSAAG